MEVLNKIKAEMAAFEERRKQLTAQLQKEFPAIFKPLFEKSNGKIKSIGWAQYTPYFNDGDECIFGVRSDSDSLYVNGEYVDDLEAMSTGVYAAITEDNLNEHQEFNSTDAGYSWYKTKKVGEQGYFPNPEYDKEMDDIVSEFSESIASIDESFYKDLFGDHVHVTINSDGTIETEEYQHD